MSDINTNKANTVQFVAVVVVIAALSRLLPHPYNFTPVAAMALFGGAYLHEPFYCVGHYLSRYAALSDVLLAGYLLGWASYARFSYPNAIGISIHSGGYAFWVATFLYGRVSARSGVLANTLLGSLIFFIITNFGVFLLHKRPHLSSSCKPISMRYHFLAIPAWAICCIVPCCFGSYESIKQRRNRR